MSFGTVNATNNYQEEKNWNQLLLLNFVKEDRKDIRLLQKSSTVDNM